MNQKRTYWISVAFLLFCMVTSYIFYRVQQNNFQVITPGEAYRSAQPGTQQLESYIRKYGIRSVINLRGKNKDAQWYQDEITVSKTYALAHYDVALVSTQEPTEEDIRTLFHIFESAPRPVLIHCQFGADRTGLVAAMWKTYVDREPQKVAGRQLSLLYGHLPFGKRYAMDRFFRDWSSSYHY